MTIDIGKCIDDSRKVSKSYTTNISANAEVWGECSIMSPVFLITYNNIAVDCNYLYVSDWGRYYFITDMVAAPGGRLYVHCKEDVLMSNKTEILKLHAYSVRSDRKANYMVDSKMPSLVQNGSTIINFSNSPFTPGNESYLLTVLGGKT